MENLNNTKDRGSVSERNGGAERKLPGGVDVDSSHRRRTPRELKRVNPGSVGPSWLLSFDIRERLPANPLSMDPLGYQRRKPSSLLQAIRDVNPVAADAGTNLKSKKGPRGPEQVHRPIQALKVSSW